MFATPMETRLRGMIEPSLSAMGYGLVVVRLHDGGKRKTLQILAERHDNKGISVKDCTDISNTVSALLDVEDPINGAYNLEVSSPGLDRPLTSAADFKRFTGQEARVELSMPIDGQRRFRGTIAGATEEEITLTVEGQPVALPVADIRTARLVATDDLIKALIKKDKAETNG